MADMERSPETDRPVRSLRYAAYFAILYGAAGALSGVVGAATFIPYGSLDNLTQTTELQLTAISAVGAAVSVLGVWVGWRLLHGRPFGWSGAMVTALAAVGTVGAMAAVWPPSSPFLGVTAFFYAIEVVLLLVGLGTVHRRPVTGAPSWGSTRKG